MSKRTSTKKAMAEKMLPHEKRLAELGLNKNKKIYHGDMTKMTTKEVWSNRKAEKAFDKTQKDTNERNRGKLNNWRYGYHE